MLPVPNMIFHDQAICPESASLGRRDEARRQQAGLELTWEASPGSLTKPGVHAQTDRKLPGPPLPGSTWGSLPFCSGAPAAVLGPQHHPSPLSQSLVVWFPWVVSSRILRVEMVDRAQVMIIQLR